MSSPDYSQAVKDIIDGLGDSPTPDAIYHAVRNYSVDNVVAAAAAAAKAGGGGGGSQPGILQAKAEFTSADLLAGELIILPAQGANTIIVPTVALGVYRFVTTPYANTGGSLYVGPNYNAADVYGGWNSVIAGSADRVSAIDFFTNYLDGTGNGLTNLTNQPMGYSLNPPTDGDGTLTIFACYTLLDFS